MPEEATGAQAEPDTGAEAAPGAGGESGQQQSTQSEPGKGDEGGDLKARLDALEAATRSKDEEIGRLRKEVGALSKQKQSVETEAKTIEEQLQELQGKFADSEAKRAEAEAKDRRRGALDQIVQSAPADLRDEARRYVLGIAAERGIDLAAEDRDAAVKSLADLVKESPLFKERAPSDPFPNLDKSSNALGEQRGAPVVYKDHTGKERRFM